MPRFDVSISKHDDNAFTDSTSLLHRLTLNFGFEANSSAVNFPIPLEHPVIKTTVVISQVRTLYQIL